MLLLVSFDRLRLACLPGQTFASNHLSHLVQVPLTLAMLLLLVWLLCTVLVGGVTGHLTQLQLAGLPASERRQLSWGLQVVYQGATFFNK